MNELPDDKLTEDDFAALLRGDAPVEPVKIGATDFGSVGASDRQAGAREVQCRMGAHFWSDQEQPPDPFSYCDCGEYTYKGFVERPR